MMIDQRNAGASSTPTSSTYVTDRWNSILTQASKLTLGQNLNSITPPIGLPNYAGFQSTSSYSLSSGDYFIMRQSIEGFNFADFGFGTVNAQTVTISFWVRSSLTGTFGGAFCNYAFTRSYPFTYIVNSANTWEQKTITIAGDTGGTWVGASASGAASLTFGLGVGSTNSGTAGAWASASYTSATGATSVVGTNGATFYITGVQLEKGSTATSFDYRPYGTELALCQRYYYKQGGDGTSTNFYSMGVEGASSATGQAGSFPVTMRAVPTVTVGSGVSFYSPASGGKAFTIATNRSSTTTASLDISITGGGATTGQAGAIYASGAGGSISYSSEL